MLISIDENEKARIAFVALSVFAIAVVIAVVWSFGQYVERNLISARLQQLTSIREGVASHVRAELQSSAGALHAFSHTALVNDALSELSVAFPKAAAEKGANANELARQLIRYYEKKLLLPGHYGFPGAPVMRPAERYLPESLAARRIQHRYLIATPDKDNPDGSTYAAAHYRHHPQFIEYRRDMGVYDIFLVDLAGTVVYSADKESDFATNLLHGPFADSGLGRAFRKAVATVPGEVVFEDFSFYEPTLNQPGAFLSVKVERDGIELGVLAIQLPIERINAVMTFGGRWKEVGLGESGECYLVGNDLRMKTNSRFIERLADPNVHRLGTTIGLTDVSTPSAKEALAGRFGAGEITDYRGVQVFSAYAPIEVFKERWSVIVEIDKAEVVDDVRSQIRNTIAIFAFISIAIAAILLVLFSRHVVKPLRLINSLLRTESGEKEKQVIVSLNLVNEYRKAVDASNIISKTDLSGHITYVNDSFCETYGYRREELIGKTHAIVKSPETPDKTYEELWHTILGKGVWRGAMKDLTKDGRVVYVNTTIVPILDIDGGIEEFIAIRSDITELMRKEHLLLRLTIDPLTGFPNRQRLLESISESRNPLLMVINIDRFKELNDTYGHEIGDIVLKRIAHRLHRVGRAVGLSLYKLASDEYALFSADVHVENDAPRLNRFCQRLIGSERIWRINLQGDEITIDVSIGAAIGKVGLITNTDMALRKAQEGHAKFMIYNDTFDLKQHYEHNLLWTRKIRDALRDDRITVYKQPIVDTRTGEIHKHECLVRMLDGQGGVISPFHFLELSKKAKLYPRITRAVIDKSFSYFAQAGGIFSINLTVADILNRETVAFLIERLQHFNLGEQLTVELVESEGIENFVDVSAFIQRIKGFGCKIAIDDFGTGYSNFDYLMRLDADYIKIDGSLVKNVVNDASTELIIRLIADFGRELRLKTIAEFCSSAEIQAKLTEIGIDYLQGYHLGEPVPLDSSRG